MRFKQACPIYALFHARVQLRQRQEKYELLRSSGEPTHAIEFLLRQTMASIEALRAQIDAAGSFQPNTPPHRPSRYAHAHARALAWREARRKSA
jgi:hypothetical protein